MKWFCLGHRVTQPTLSFASDVLFYLPTCITWKLSEFTTTKGLCKKTICIAMEFSSDKTPESLVLCAVARQWHNWNWIGLLSRILKYLFSTKLAGLNASPAPQTQTYKYTSGRDCMQQHIAADKSMPSLGFVLMMNHWQYFLQQPWSYWITLW